MHSFSALISDLDGTLVDTEPAHADAWLSVLADYGLHYDHAWFEQWIGTSDRFLAEAVVKEHQLEMAVRDLQNLKQVLYHELVPQEDRLFMDISSSLATIHQAYPTAIATNSGRADAEVVFKATGLMRYFQTSVTADDVAKLKPSPEMYLKAAALLDKAPANCLVCEDSPAGTAGAKAAGCYVIGISHGKDHTRLAEADEVVEQPHEAFKRVVQLLQL